MPGPPFELRLWCDEHQDVFAALHADTRVMADQSGPLDRKASDAKLERYSRAWRIDGISRWAIHLDREFAGYAGVIRRHELAWLLGPHVEIGWRLRREFWGRGIATASAHAALEHAWRVIPEDEVLCYTSPDNARSQAVISRLGLVRDPSRDFTVEPKGKPWRGLVWQALRPG